MMSNVDEEVSSKLPHLIGFTSGRRRGFINYIIGILRIVRH